jgi:hypothetical protein
MKKSSKKQQFVAGAESRPAKVVGLDLGDRYSHDCKLTRGGEVMEEGKIRTEPAALGFSPQTERGLWFCGRK